MQNRYAGDHCKKLGLSINQFYCASQTTKITNIKKGPVYELCQVRKSRGTPWKDFYELMRAVCDASFTVSFDSFKVMVGRLEKKRSLLLRNKKKDDIEILFGEPFCGMHTIPEPITEDTVLTRERAKTEELTAKLQHLSVRNVNKRIKRRDLRLLNHRPRSKKWTEKENLKIRASPNLKLNCTLLIALFTVFDKGSIDLKIRLKLHPMKPLIFTPS